MFSASEELAMLDAIAVANFGRQTDHGPTSTTRIWNPLFCHLLQPAQHFRGREAELEELKKWLQKPRHAGPGRLTVAAGGAGKAALNDKALHVAEHSDGAGLFVWSFYEDPKTDSSLRAAHRGS